MIGRTWDSNRAGQDSFDKIDSSKEKEYTCTREDFNLVVKTGTYLGIRAAPRWVERLDPCPTRNAISH